jgi:hypothetical protein
MLRITLDRATMQFLHNLSEPMELCDETGLPLGRFFPDMGGVVGMTMPPGAMAHHPSVAGLGEEISVFGYEEDLE